MPQRQRAEFDRLSYPRYNGRMAPLFLPILLVLAAAPSERMQQAGTPLMTAAAPDRAAERDRLFRYLAEAATETDGRAVEDEIWRFWLSLAPDAESRRLVDEAMKRRENYDLAGAETLLDEAIARAPDYAEAYNQRAFIRFLRDNDEGAEADIRTTLDLEPKHFGALAGLFQIEFRRGRAEAAYAALIEAIRIHPWLKERSMLPADPKAERPPVRGREQDL